MSLAETRLLWRAATNWRSPPSFRPFVGSPWSAGHAWWGIRGVRYIFRSDFLLYDGVGARRMGAMSGPERITLGGYLYG